MFITFEIWIYLDIRVEDLEFIITFFVVKLNGTNTFLGGIL